MTDKILLSGKWNLQGNGYSVCGSVPGDVTDDLLKNGIVPDPYIDYNYRDCEWVVRSDWNYSKKFSYVRKNGKRVFLLFKGVDTYAEVFLNGTNVGNCRNMHREYRFEVTDFICDGENELSVNLKNVYDNTPVNDGKYDSIFNGNRIFVRKAQCHFGWDWAPKLPGYGIYRDVYLEETDDNLLIEKLIDVDGNGNATFRLQTEKLFEGKMRITFFYKGEQVTYSEKDISCRKTILNLHVNDVKQWMPNGYGNPELYEYKIEYVNKNGEVEIVDGGKTGFKTVKLFENPVDSENLDFAFEINGIKVFCRGGNWVPAECMTGRLKDEKIRFLLESARAVNFNMLRVWGGGVYESDLFYETCDELGIMIWQDFMFACSEIPEDQPWFLNEITEESALQIKRLNAHPCITYWCGANEVRGAFVPTVDERYSYFTTHYLLRGLVADLDKNIPYGRTSPYSYGDTDNERFEGDCHDNISEPCLFGASFKGFDDFEYGTGNDADKVKERLKRFYLYLQGTKSNFSSECAVLGGCSYKSLEKFCSESNRDLDGDFFKERFLGNPYTYVLPDFIDRQKVITEALYGKSSDVASFLTNINRAQAEIMKAEIVYARTNGRSNGILTWMYNDIWPTGTWSVIDYYLDKKPAYYTMKRCFAPEAAAFFRERNKVCLALMNDGVETIAEISVFGAQYGKDASLIVSGNYKIKERSNIVINIEEYEKYDYLFVAGRMGQTKLNDLIDINLYTKEREEQKVRAELSDGILTVTALTKCDFVEVNGVSNMCEYGEENFFPMYKGETRKFAAEKGDINVTVYYATERFDCPIKNKGEKIVNI